LATVIKEQGLSLEKVLPSISMAGKSREYREVIQHYRCLEQATIFTREYLINDRLRLVKENMRLETQLKFGEKAVGKAIELFNDFLMKSLNKKRLGKKNLLTEGKIKQLHKIIARGLLPDDVGVEAGVYRIDVRSVGWDISLPGPELIDDCMKKFIVNAQRLIDKVNSSSSGNLELFDVAAKISYDFVRVHPFPDFNGRISRILMNMVLQATGSVVVISIRGDRKGRRRYFSSLKHANGGNIKSLSALIAMRVVESSQEIDANLTQAGVLTIKEAAKQKG